MRFLLVFFVALAVTAQDFDWVAPVPMLPGTGYLDYGWDSTSNGPVVITSNSLSAVRLAQKKLVVAPPPLPVPLTPVKRARVNLVIEVIDDGKTNHYVLERFGANRATSSPRETEKSRPEPFPFPFTR